MTTDMLGNPIYSGDLIVYPTASGSSTAAMNLAVVSGLTSGGRLQVRKLRVNDRVWGTRSGEDPNRQFYIERIGRVVVVTDSARAAQAEAVQQQIAVRRDV